VKRKTLDRGGQGPEGMEHEGFHMELLVYTRQFSQECKQRGCGIRKMKDVEVSDFAGYKNAQTRKSNGSGE